MIPMIETLNKELTEFSTYFEFINHVKNEAFK